MAQIFNFKSIIKNSDNEKNSNSTKSHFSYSFENTIYSEKIEINNNEYVLKEEKICKSNYYIDISYVKNGQVNLIGRYDKFCKNISVENSENYILVYSWDFNSTKEKIRINKILSLYNKSDCNEIVGTYEELGKIFNDSVTKKQEFDLPNSNKLLYRTDVVRKRRF